MSSIYKKLLEIQKHIDSFTKDTRGHGFSYASGSQVLNKIRPIMNEQGLILKQEVLSAENTRIDYTTASGKDKSEILTNAQMLFTWIDTDTGEKDESKFYASGMNGWEQGLGSALTYGERYFLLKFFHVPTDGDDVDSVKKPNSQDLQDSKVDNKRWLEISAPEWKSALGKGSSVADLRKYFKISKANAAEYEKQLKELNNLK